MRNEKQLLLEEIKEQIGRYGSFVLMRYQGLNANKANDFRRELAKLGGDLEVVRKRVLVKAAHEAGITLDKAELEGHVGLVLAGKDALETTKVVIQFGESNDNVVQVIGGRIDGQLYSATDMVKLSKLPGKQEMRAQLLSVLEAPMSQTLAVFEALLSSVVYCLDNKSKKDQK